MSSPHTTGAPAERIGFNGVELSTRRLGDGPPLVALHGGPGLDHHFLLPLAERLAADHEVWLPDLPGHGRSVPASGRLPGLARLEESLGRWLAGLAAQRPAPILLGHSLGAWLTVAMLRHRILTARAAILLAPPAPGRRPTRLGVPPPPASDARREIAEHLRSELPAGLPLGLRTALERAEIRSPTSYRALVRNLRRQLEAPLRGFTPSCPVLVLSGEDDRTTPPEEGLRLALSLDNARHETLPGGHWFWAERPDAVIALIAELLPPPTGDRG